MQSNGSGATMTIGELADQFGLATHVLRHWESEGLLTPATRVNGRRRYRADQVARVATILRGKSVGFSLRDIKAMLEAPDATARREVLQRHHAALEERIAEAEAAKEMVAHALTCEFADFTRCPTYQHITERSCHIFKGTATFSTGSPAVGSDPLASTHIRTPERSRPGSGSSPSR